MLNFTGYLEKLASNRRDANSRRDYGLFRDDDDDENYEISPYVCKYLLAMQKDKKLIKLGNNVYKSLINFWGRDGLKEVIDYAKKYFKENFKGSEEVAKAIKLKIARVRKQKNCEEGWLALLRLVNSSQWKSGIEKPYSITKFFCYLLKKQVDAHEKNQEKSIFEKRLDLLCKTLDINDINKEFLRFIYLHNYDGLVEHLHDCICKAFKISQNINYAVVAMLTNYPEEAVMESISSERGVTSLGILSYGLKSSIEIPLEIKRYLKGLGSDNLMDIYATIDKKPPLALEKFSFQKEAQFITDLISMHKNERPLHFLLYGVEGTGKTELARAIAANANCELLDIGRGLKKRLFENDGDLTDSVTKFRIRALNVAEIMFRNKTNLVLLVDEADVLLNHLEKGILNQMLEDMRLPVIWVSNSLFWMQRSTMRRFSCSIEFKANTPSMRQKLWEHVVEKHNAKSTFTTERIKELAEKYDVAPGGIELAVANEMMFVNNGKQEQVAEFVLKQHTELLGLRNEYKNTQTRALKYDESILNVKGIENAINAAKSYAELLKDKKTESNCTMLLYGAPGTGKTEFARYLARISGLPFKEISYGKISSMWVGETEKKLAAAFEDASEEGALLFIDEADSLISDRRSANHSWETTQVNEFLIQLENSKCLVVCSTNFQGKLDTASNRRFHFHLKFDYLQKEGILKMAKNFFPDYEQENWTELCHLECLTPGDFYAVHKRLQWFPKQNLSVASITKELSDIALAKEPYGNRRIGF